MRSVAAIDYTLNCGAKWLCCCVLFQEQTTQTPDVWMTNVNGKHFICFTGLLTFLTCMLTLMTEQPFAMPTPAAAIMRGSVMARPGLSRQNSGIRGAGSGGLPMGSPLQNMGKSFAAAAIVPGKEEGRVDVGGFQPPAFKLETAAACQLITYIYSSKVWCNTGQHCLRRTKRSRGVLTEFS
jgi:hypothetical protein